ncbi:MAG: hypothetical protein PUK25_02695 [Clostridiales bacterium]|nr:hypothetical protein [Clostridiales bacterium]MDY5702091.1 hypothetical protein [Eubacteriales bacterium]
MISFIDLPGGWKTFILCLMLLLNLYQFGYLFMLYMHKKIRLLLLNLLPTVFIFAAMPLLGNSVHNDSGCLKDAPVAAILLIWLLIGIYTAVSNISESRKAREMLTLTSVKETFDTLPAGICFFSESGLPVLCNKQMHRLAYRLLGKDLQMQQELKSALVTPAKGVEVLKIKEKNCYRMPDGTVWAFSETVVKSEAGIKYTQFTATEFTKLYNLQEELAERNAELEEMITQVQRISENIAEITRQQEILTAKMRVHNKMGNCLLSARQYMVQNFPHDKKAQFLELWQSSLCALKDEITAQDEPDVCDEVLRIAKSIGVDVQIHGTMPEDTHAAYLLLVALRECVTNALNHAGANLLYLTITNSSGQISAVYTNNGKQPKQEIIEGGGLASLRERIERAGGIMTVQSLPFYSLTLTLPEYTKGGNSL